jgi:heterodisulfide reductase subunit B2
MKIGYFPGCSLSGTAREYDESLRRICSSLNIELHEIKDWNCCGASAAHSLNRLLSLALPARILALAAEQSISELLIPCAACYHRLMATMHEIKQDAGLQQQVCETIKMPLPEDIKLLNILDFLQKYFLTQIPDLPLQSFNHQVACYYGCLLVRPPDIIKFERYEDPMVMEEIVQAVGARPVKWAYKVECCGAGLSISRTDIVARLAGKIIEDAECCGAEAIIVACPMCHSNLDMRRKQIERSLQRKSKIPVLYLTQVIGMAMGISRRALGLHRHFVPVKLAAGAKTAEVL